MNKTELVQKIVSGPREVHTKAAIEATLAGLADAVAAELAAGGQVIVPGLGKFEATRRAARTARNPRTGEEISVPEKRVVKFKAAKGLREAVE